jgi:all-trans-8'-apo-beta-carotenal 15,15'-oxygenase
MQTLEKPKQQRSYNPEDWKRGYQSQRQELDYWIEEIDGQIPPDLKGILFRNGPGLLDINGELIHHPFDGDGMICRIEIANGRAHFRNRYVRTEGYLAEQKAGKILYRGVFGTQKPGGWLANLFDIQFKNIANTHVIYWGNKLLALWEAAEPHRLDPVTLETIGLDNLNGLLKPGDPFAAHPRIDPGSPHTNGQRRLVNFSVKPGLSSRITVYEFDPEGNVAQQQTRSVPGFAFLHDFVLTPHYYIFFQNPVGYNPLPFLFGMRGAGQCLESQPDRPTQAIVIPRDPAQPMHLIPTTSCFVFHHANAFEQDGKLWVDSLCYDHFPLVGPETFYLDVEFEKYPSPQLWRFCLDLQAQTAERHCLESRCCEFPSLHPDKVGQNVRYLYLGAAHAPTGHAPLQAIFKIDLVSGERKLHSFAPRGFVGEPIFVPRPGSAAEDGGWVLVLAYDGAHHRSDLVIFNAQTLEPEAILHLKQHIPYGLHGSFVSG